MVTTCTISLASGTYTGAQIKSARIVEQISPLSVEIPMNTLTFVLHSDTGEFSITNPSGTLANLQYKTPVEVYGFVTGTDIYMGKFYLDTWESLSESEARFTAVDGVSLMNGIYLSGIYGLWTDASVGVSAWDLIADIATEGDFEYAIAADTPNPTLYGLVPKTSCREALQNVLFRIGAYATCSRSDVLEIKPAELASSISTPDHILTASDKGIGRPILLRPEVTGVKVISHNYKQNVGGEIQIRFDITLDAGQHLIIFDQPRPAGTWSGTATVNPLESGVFWELVEVSVGGTWIFESEGFIDSKLTFSVSNPSPVGILNTVEINNATMVNKANAQTVTQRVYDYYSQRYLQQVRLYGKNVAPGDTVFVISQSGKWIAGVAERVETDLAGGFISDVEIVGTVFGCNNFLTANTSIASGTTQTYVGCLDMLDYNLTLEVSAVVSITD